MTRTQNWNGLESAPRWIMTTTGAYLVASLFVLYVCHRAGPGLALEASSDSSGMLSATGMAAVELGLCMLVLRSFRAGAPLAPRGF